MSGPEKRILCYGVHNGERWCEDQDFYAFFATREEAQIFQGSWINRNLLSKKDSVIVEIRSGEFDRLEEVDAAR